MDDSAIEGVWQIETAELSGEKMPDLVAHKIELHLSRGTYSVHFGGEIADHGTYTPATHATARGFTLKGIAGTNAGRTIPAIYRLVDGRLHVCYGLDGAAPGEFSTRPGAAHFLAVYRRRPAD